MNDLTFDYIGTESLLGPPYSLGHIIRSSAGNFSVWKTEFIADNGAFFWRVHTHKLPIGY